MTIDSDFVDPWCLSGCDIDFTWSWTSLATFLVQIFSTLVAYGFAWVSCTMTLEWCSMAFPMLLATPFSILSYYIAAWLTSKEESLFPFDTRHHGDLDDNYAKAAAIACALWVSQVLGMGYFFWTRSKHTLAQDTDIFLVPHYDGVFLSQQLVFNRQEGKYVKGSAGVGQGPAKKSPKTVFICSTMYRESDIEMKQMLTSIYRVACHQYNRKLNHKNKEEDRFESHIFFDGSLNESQFTHFPLQLLSVLEETLKVDLQCCKKEQTPYGYRLSWLLCDTMPFTIHMKDNLKVKNKKRWSQVMYMNYVINHRIKAEQLEPENTYILTTDADMDFTADSAILLLDMLVSNPKVGAACARTHPKGTGPLYWYQVFDYAISHWFMKSTEHILGCVLCCPGCFSMFRCNALMDALEAYATNTTGAFEFLIKDMGEDRWLCTLLIEHGWRLEYCAISEDHTYCPEGFDEFFKQRRRWIPSTIATSIQLIANASKLTNMNDSVSIPFILFEFIILFYTVISPATVILVITMGMGVVYSISMSTQIAIMVILVLVSVGYGVVCLYTSQQTQLDVAKLLTFFFSVIMVVLIAGILKDIISTAITAPKSDLPHHDENSTDDDIVTFLLSSSTKFYGFSFAMMILIAAILHLPEWHCIIHFILYLVAFPSGYLLLLIYAVANLDSQSWGTRESTVGGDQGGYATVVSFLKTACDQFVQCINWLCGAKRESGGMNDKEKQLLGKSTPMAATPPEGKLEKSLVIFYILLCNLHCLIEEGCILCC